MLISPVMSSGPDDGLSHPPHQYPSDHHEFAASLQDLRASLYSSFESIVPLYIPEAPALDLQPLEGVPDALPWHPLQLWQPQLYDSPMRPEARLEQYQTAAARTKPTPPLQAPLPQKQKGTNS